MKYAAPVMFVTLLLIAAATFFSPEQWKWPIIGTVFFFGFFISTRLVAKEIGEEIEKRFNKRE